VPGQGFDAESRLQKNLERQKHLLSLLRDLPSAEGPFSALRGANSLPPIYSNLPIRHSRNQAGFLALKHSKSEYRNPKQIQNPNFLMTQTFPIICFGFWSLDIVSTFACLPVGRDFVLRI
jgi:hypothetical protein